MNDNKYYTVLVNNKATGICGAKKDILNVLENMGNLELEKIKERSTDVVADMSKDGTRYTIFKSTFGFITNDPSEKIIEFTLEEMDYLDDDFGLNLG